MNSPSRPRAYPSLQRRRPFLGALALLLALLAACGSSAGSSPTPPAGTTLPSLDGTTWRATLIGDVAPLADAPPTIQFDAGQAGGTTGCNSYGGAYQVGADGAFRIESMLMTEMACDGPRGNQESVVIEILTAADTIEVLADGQIRISGPKGSITFAEDPR